MLTCDGSAVSISSFPRTDHSSFVPHIQGLRAIAVLGVVAFHLWPSALPGGFVGVDVFFVISGFLITGHLRREILATGTVRLAAFWGRRVRRLLPAALVVLGFCAVVISVPSLALLSALPARVKEIVAATSYVANWQLVATSANYFGDSNSPTFARHYWSLSTEEQFYLVWPLALLAGVAIARRVHRRSTAGTIGAVLLISLVSFGASVWFTEVSPAAAYFATFTRVWEFGAGALLALFPRLRARSASARMVCGWLGLAGLTMSFALMSDAIHFPGYAALLPVAATVLILAVVPGGAWWFPTRLISLPPFDFVGKISYSLYLWHWPLILVVPALPWWTGGITQTAALLLVTVVLSWLTQRFVEDPLRSWPWLVGARPRRTFAVGGAAMAAVVVLTIGLGAVNLPQFLSARSALADLRADPTMCSTPLNEPAEACDVLSTGGFFPASSIAGMDSPQSSECLAQFDEAEPLTCSFGTDDPDAPSVLLIGDSHAFQYIDVLADVAVREGWRLTTALKGGCPWSTTKLASEVPFARVCDEWRDNVSGWLLSQTPAVIVTSAYSGTQYAVDGYGSRTDAAVAGFAGAWSSPAVAAVPILAVTDNPAFPTNPNLCLLNRAATDCDVPRAQAVPAPDPMSSAAEARPNVHVLDNTDIFCDDAVCSPVVGNRNAYRDPNHLTASFAASLGSRLTVAIQRVLDAHPQGQ
ncbi:Peptidoglycan/LPS O-acetylase OafA/YrhL, contains acyltransferase and SGNH-hydrolase domains [Microbacterium sp. RURRCA19A]|nr:Peptidoglycan/LPS O-acetylase OafA/YrhL, contains acyltransferase and SGNH-hydrolase domains [Microbacterium sp. RURRCA19A]